LISGARLNQVEGWIMKYVIAVTVVVMLMMERRMVLRLAKSLLPR
jgi:hypothetical protein